MNAEFHVEKAKFMRRGRVVRVRRLVCVLDGVHVGVSRSFDRREALASAAAVRDRAVREAMEALAAVCPKVPPAVAMPWLERAKPEVTVRSLSDWESRVDAHRVVAAARGQVRAGVNLMTLDTSDLCAELERRGYEVAVAS
jgi:hypothetical protein